MEKKHGVGRRVCCEFQTEKTAELNRMENELRRMGDECARVREEFHVFQVSGAHVLACALRSVCMRIARKD